VAKGGPQKKDGLTPKQKLFIDEYLIDLNATQAAIRAGYNKISAKVIGHENLTKPYIYDKIEEALQKRAERTEITQDRVLKEYARLAFVDPRRFYDENGDLKSIVNLDADTAACIAGMDVKVVAGADGEPEKIKKIKITDKKGALDSVARHLGMFDKDRSGGDRITFNNINFGKKTDGD